MQLHRLGVLGLSNDVHTILCCRSHWPEWNTYQSSIGRKVRSKSVKVTVMKFLPNGHAEHTAEMNTFAFAHGIVDLTRAEIIYRDGQRCALSQREVQLLAYLARRPGIPVSRDELLFHIWKMNPARTLTRTIDMHVSHLRRKLRDDAKKPAFLLTVSGCGYMLAAPSGFQR